MNKTIKISGMSCSHCVAAVEGALKGISGVESAKADLASESAVVSISGSVSDEALKKAIEEEDFEVVSITAG
ncbi:copper ion-binding protein [Synergistales bacterium]|nr:copper ion-binding protein [Synergistales bacterium]